MKIKILYILLVVLATNGFSQQIIWQNDFSNPSNWVIGYDAGHSSGDWTITTNASASPISALNPAAFTSVANGYAIINSDAEGSNASQNALIYFDGNINLTGQSTVGLTFQQTHRRFAENTYVIYSLDGGATWQDVEVNVGMDGNTNTTNPQTVYVNLSSQIGGQASVKIGFRYIGNYDWFWAVDDVKLIIPSTNDLSLNKVLIGSIGSWGTKMAYHKVPISQINPISVSGIVSNNGLNQNNVIFSTSVSGTTFNSNSNNNSLNFFQTDTLNANLNFTPPSQIGSYSFTSSVSGNVESNTSDNLFNGPTIQVSNNIYARDNDVLTGGIPMSNNNEGVGVVYDIYNNTSISKIQFFVHPNSSIGEDVYVKIFSIDPNTSNLVFIEQSDSYTLTQSDLGQFLSIPLVNNVALNANTSYFVHVGSYYSSGLVYGISGAAELGTAFSIANDNIQGSLLYKPVIRMILCDGVQPINQIMNISACQTYTSQSGQVYTQSGTYTEVIPNVNGCDSVILTLNLTVPFGNYFGTSYTTVSPTCNNSTNGEITLSVISPNVIGPDLMLTEYYSGTGSNKAIEIYNPTNESWDLGGIIQIPTGAIGPWYITNSSGQSFWFPPNTIIAPHNTIVVSNIGASGIFSNISTSVVNGTDITLGYSSTVPFIGGNISSDISNPISGQTIIRDISVNTVNGGNPTPSEWNSLPLSSATLGSHFNDNAPGYSIVWSDGTIGSTLSNISPGYYDYSVSHNSTGCILPEDSIVLINTFFNDNISITPNPAFGNAPLNVAFANQTPNLSNYNFTWFFGDGTSQQSNSPFLSHTYTQNGYADVTVVANNITTGCSSSQTFDDMIFVIGGVTCTHTATLNQSTALTGCVGDSLLLSCNIDPSFTYQWNRNGIPVSGATSSSIYPTQSGSYTVTIYQNNCPVTSAGISVTVNPLPSVPTITSSGTITPCSGGSMTLTAPSGFTSYLWNTGSTSSSLVVSQSGNYSVTVTNTNGCSRTSNPFVVNASFMQPQQVCIVGMDSLTNENKIIWEKPVTLGIDSFYVYKETNVSNVYAKIGGTDYADLAILLDANSNPAVQAYRYKVSILDTCGVETNLGDFHKTIHLTINQGIGGAWNLIWSHYEGLNFGSYNIYRGTDPTNISLLTTIQSNLNSYTDLTPPTGPLYYQIEVVNPLNCDPTKSLNYGVSRSNIVNNGQIGVNENKVFQYNVYPNPTNGVITLQSAPELIGNSFTILDFMGRILMQDTISNIKQDIDMMNFAKGTYYLKIEGALLNIEKLIKN